MRLLSFCNQVEATLAVLRPDDAASGWLRRADYQAGSATCWHPVLGLSLVLRACALAGDRHSLVATWHGPAGQELFSRTFFCAVAYEWQAAAEAGAEAMPEPLLQAPADSPAELDAGAARLA